MGALPLILRVFLLACSLNLALAQQGDFEASSCPGNLTQDGSCQLPGTSGPAPSAVLFATELKAALTARCYAICAQNHTEEVSKTMWSAFKQEQR